MSGRDDKRFSWTDHRGWTLMEAVVGLALLSLLSVQFMAVAVNTSYWMAEAGRETQASHYAYGVLEILRADKEQFLIQSAHAYQVDIRTLQTIFPVPEDMLAQVNALPRGDAPHLQQITVQVWWSDKDYVQMQTLLAF